MGRSLDIAVLAACALLGASGCATLEPAEPCTSTWYDYKRDQAFAPVRSELSKALDRMRSAQLAMQSNETASFGAILDMALALEGGLSVIDATEQQAIPTLQAAARQCGSNTFVRRAVLEFLDDEGVGELFSSGGEFAALGPALEMMLQGGTVEDGFGL